MAIVVVLFCVYILFSASVFLISIGTLSVILSNVALLSIILISVVLDCVTLLSVILMKLFVSLC